MPKPKTKPAQPDLDHPRREHDLAFVLELLADVAGDHDDRALGEVVRSLLEPVRWEHVTPLRLRSVFLALMDTSAGPGEMARDRERSDAIGDRARSEHQQRCACCRAKAKAKGGAA